MNGRPRKKVGLEGDWNEFWLNLNGGDLLEDFRDCFISYAHWNRMRCQGKIPPYSLAMEAIREALWKSHFPEDRDTAEVFASAVIRASEELFVRHVPNDKIRKVLREESVREAASWLMYHRAKEHGSVCRMLRSWGIGGVHEDCVCFLPKVIRVMLRWLGIIRADGEYSWRETHEVVRNNAIGIGEPAPD